MILINSQNFVNDIDWKFRDKNFASGINENL